MKQQRNRRLWWVMVLLVGLGASGCSCQGIGLEVPDSENTQTQTGATKQPPRSTPKLPPKQTPTDDNPVVDITDDANAYAVQGVMALTFYPKEQTAKLGSLGGYLLLYDKPQETTVQFASLQNNECKFRSFKPSSGGSIEYRGSDAGSKLTLGFAGQSWDWERKPFIWMQQDAGVYYLAPSVENFTYPYGDKVSLKGPGGDNVKAFALEWNAPAHLTLLEPALNFQDSLEVSREKDWPLRWRFQGKAPYLAVRINQHDADGSSTRSLTCRFAPEGPGLLPASELRKFKADSAGEYTHVFFFAGRYLLAKLPGQPKPLFVVMEAISTSSLVMK